MRLSHKSGDEVKGRVGKVLPAPVQWAGRRGWRSPPPLSSGRHLSSVQRTRWCLWAGGGRILGCLERPETEQHHHAAASKFRRSEQFEVTVQTFKHPLTLRYVIGNLWLTARAASRDPHYVSSTANCKMAGDKPRTELCVQNISNLEITKPSW